MDERSATSANGFQTTLSSIGDAVIATDDHGTVTFVNPETEKLTGWQRKEAVGLPLLIIFRLVNEDTRQPAEDPVQRVLAEGTVRKTGETYRTYHQRR